MQNDLRRYQQEQEAILEQYYTQHVQELATLLHEDEAIVQAKIAYLVRTTGRNKYLVIDTILTYHRTDATLLEAMQQYG